MVSPGLSGRVHGLVCLRARMRLDVGPGRAEEFLRAFDGERLGDIDELASAVVTPAGIALGVLVRKLAALRDEHRATHVVLRRDQLDVLFLALVLAADGVPDLGIRLRKEVGERAWLGPGKARSYQPLDPPCAA